MAKFAVLLPLPSYAQQVSLAVQMGMYAPAHSLHELPPVQLPGTEQVYRLETGTSRGLALELWPGRRVGLVASWMQVPTVLRHTSPAGVDRQHATLDLGSLQGSFAFVPATAQLRPFVTAGIGGVRRRGAPFDSEPMTSSFAMIAGGGVAIQLGRFNLSTAIEVVDYNASYPKAGGYPRDFSQRDYHFRLGSGVRFVLR